MDPIPPAGAARPFSLGRHVLALAWDTAETRPVGRLRLRVDGALAPPPVAVTTLPLAAGGVRRLMSVRAPDGVPATIEAVDRAGTPVAAASADRHPASDPREILKDLSDEGRRRFLVFALTVAPGLFGLAEEPAWLRLCDEVCAEGAGRSRVLHARCSLPGGYWLVEGPALRAGDVTGTATLLTRAGLRRLPLAASWSSAGRTLLALAEPPAPPDREMPLVLPGTTGALVAWLAPPATSLPDLAAWLRGPGRTSRGAALDVLAAMAAGHVGAAGLLRELRLGDVPARGRLDVGIACGELLVAAGRLADAAGVVEGIMLGCAGRQIAPTTLARRAVAPGRPERFVALARFPQPVPLEAPCRGHLCLGSGRLVAIGEAPAVRDAGAARRALLAAFSGWPATHAAVRDVLRPALRALRAEEPVPLDEVGIGTMPDEPDATVLLAARADPDVLRCQVAAIATARPSRPLDVAVLLEDMANAEAVSRHLRGLHATYDLALRLLVPERGFGAGALLAEACRTARARTVVWLATAVVPLGRDWLEALRRPLRGDALCAVASGRILHADGSLRDAGATLARDSEGHLRATIADAGLPHTLVRPLGRLEIPAAGAFAFDLPRLGELAASLVEAETEAGIAAAFGLAARLQGRTVVPSPASFLALSVAAPQPALAEVDRMMLAERWPVAAPVARAAMRGLRKPGRSSRQRAA